MTQLEPDTEVTATATGVVRFVAMATGYNMEPGLKKRVVKAVKSAGTKAFRIREVHVLNDPDWLPGVVGAVAYDLLMDFAGDVETMTLDEKEAVFLAAKDQADQLIPDRLCPRLEAAGLVDIVFKHAIDHVALS